VKIKDLKMLTRSMTKVVEEDSVCVIVSVVDEVWSCGEGIRGKMVNGEGWICDKNVWRVDRHHEARWAYDEEYEELVDMWDSNRPQRDVDGYYLNEEGEKICREMDLYDRGEGEQCQCKSCIYMSQFGNGDD